MSPVRKGTRSRKSAGRRNAPRRPSKAPQRRQARADDLQDFPIFDRAPNWFFRVEEISAGIYKVEGRDLLNRRISRTGPDKDRLLDECAAEAAASDQRDG
jgi:hypothetical protein